MLQKKFFKAVSSREQSKQLRKEAILKAAFSEFTQKGFALTRIDDIAKKAHVSKGSIYNHFDSKEALLEALVKEHILPVLPTDSALFDKGTNTKDFIRKTFLGIMREAQSDAGNLLHLIISEGERFPKVAEIYYRTVVANALARVGKLLEIAAARGELKDPAYLAFPQLIAAPLIQSIIWNKLFSNFHPVNFEKMLEVYLNNIFKTSEKKEGC